MKRADADSSKLWSWNLSHQQSAATGRSHDWALFSKPCPFDMGGTNMTFNPVRAALEVVFSVRAHQEHLLKADTSPTGSKIVCAALGPPCPLRVSPLSQSCQWTVPSWRVNRRPPGSAESSVNWSWEVLSSSSGYFGEKIFRAQLKLPAERALPLHCPALVTPLLAQGYCSCLTEHPVPLGRVNIQLSLFLISAF